MSHIVLALGALVYSHVVTGCSCRNGLFEGSDDVTPGVFLLSICKLAVVAMLIKSCSKYSVVLVR
jgi:hypothetical protein